MHWCATGRRRALAGWDARPVHGCFKGAIGIRNARRSRVEGRDVLLVDDVLTSGATSRACVKVLKRAGATRVTIACFARVLDEALPHSAASSGGPKRNARDLSVPGAT
ncbi:ComF family protein [Qipengyuania flava]|uniref:ComF family protein n=1 Tax=Qipengyuania flava TaxID=192812 RepID=UPI003BB03BDE